MNRKGRAKMLVVQSEIPVCHYKVRKGNLLERMATCRACLTYTLFWGLQPGESEGKLASHPGECAMSYCRAAPTWLQVEVGCLWSCGWCLQHFQPLERDMTSTGMNFPFLSRPGLQSAGHPSSNYLGYIASYWKWCSYSMSKPIQLNTYYQNNTEEP